MNISFNNALGPAPQALELRSRRTEVLASNIANADTPNYKARDISFKDALSTLLDSQQNQSQGLAIAQTRNDHLASSAPTSQSNLMYRNPLLPALDGNTVDVHKEQADFAENSLQFQAAYQFLNGRFKGLMTAIRGE